MRFLRIIASIAVFSAILRPETAAAQYPQSVVKPPNFTIAPPSEYNPNDPCPFGSYSCDHHLMHKPTLGGLNTVEQLQEALSSSCCEGPASGECRPTRIVRHEGQQYAWLDRQWCPIEPFIISYEVVMPKEVAAVVCASQELMPNGCPVANYCASSGFES